MELRETVTESQQQWEAMRDIQQLNWSWRDSERQPATIGESKGYADSPWHLERQWEKASNSKRQWISLSIIITETQCLFKLLYGRWLSLPEFLYVSLCLPRLLSVSHCLVSLIELLDVSHCLPWFLAITHCLSCLIKMLHVCHCLKLFLAVYHCLSFPMELLHVYHSLLWLVDVSYCLFGLMEFLHVSHCLQCCLAVSDCLFGTMKLLHVYHCPLYLLHVSHCLLWLLAASLFLSVRHGVAGLLSLSPLVSCSFWLSLTVFKGC